MENYKPGETVILTHYVRFAIAPYLNDQQMILATEAPEWLKNTLKPFQDSINL
jgi:hypothetical protein